MSDALNDITCRDKNDDYDWLGRHNAYWQSIYDLEHEYNKTNHYSKSRAGSSTWIYAVWATCPTDSTSRK